MQSLDVHRGCQATNVLQPQNAIAVYNRQYKARSGCTRAADVPQKRTQARKWQNKFQNSTLPEVNQLRGTAIHKSRTGPIFHGHRHSGFVMKRAWTQNSIGILIVAG